MDRSAGAGLVTTPFGWHPNIPDTEYHRSPALSSSFLRTLLGRSPAHAMAQRLEPQPETPALTLGRPVHGRVLEPESFGSRFAVAPKVDRRTKQGKAEYEAFCAAHPGAVILSESDGELVNAIGAAVRAHPLAPRLITGGQAEVSGFFNDPETGIACRIRPDYLHTDAGLMVDLKTTLDASAREFARSIWRYRYDMQAAFYAMGFEAITGEPLNDFVFIVVEKAPPYAVGMYRLDESALAQGARDVRRALDIAAQCMERDHWPAYSESIEPITLPVWALNLDNDE